MRLKQISEKNKKEGKEKRQDALGRDKVDARASLNEDLVWF